MVDRQRNGDESFFEGNLGGVRGMGREACTGVIRSRWRRRAETRRGQQDGDAGDAPGSVSTLGLRIFIMMG